MTSNTMLNHSGCTTEKYRGFSGFWCKQGIADGTMASLTLNG